MKMKFKTPFDKAERQLTNSGSRFKTKYRLEIEKNGPYKGRHVVVPDGVYKDGQFYEVKDDIYSEIQSHKNSCDIHWIIDHFQNNPMGLAQRLERNTGAFIDCVDMPRNFMEMQQLIIDAKNEFFGLDPDVRAKFGNDPEQFLAQIGSSEFLEKLGVKKNETLSVDSAVAGSDSAEAASGEN